MTACAATPCTLPPLQHKDDDAWEKLGGLEGVASVLHTSLTDGASPAEVALEARRAAFGANRFKSIPPKSFFTLLIAQLKDPTLIMLMVAAAVRRTRRRWRGGGSVEGGVGSLKHSGSPASLLSGGAGVARIGPAEKSVWRSTRA